MRKLKLQMQMSADGFVGGLNGSMDWLVFNWDNALNEYVKDVLTSNIDLIVMGRKLAEGFIPHWAAKVNSEDPQEAEAAKIFSYTPRLVFSRTLTECAWENAEVTKAPLAASINQLKQEGDGDILAYGGATFIAGLVQEDLIDEYHLFVNPAFVGQGMSITHLLNASKHLTLKHSQAFSCGIVLLCYVPLRNA